MDQYRIPCVIMRAGTSKGIFLKENDLPAPGPERDAMILQIFGSPTSARSTVWPVPIP